MPKVLPLSQTERKKQEFKKWIKGKKASEDITNKDIAVKMFITEQAVARKIRLGNFSYTDLICLFKELNATDEEIVAALRG